MFSCFRFVDSLALLILEQGWGNLFIIADRMNCVLSLAGRKFN